MRPRPAPRAGDLLQIDGLMLVGWRAGYVATLGACAVGVVSLQTRGAGAVRITGAQSVGGEIEIDFSSGAGDHLGVKSGDYVYPSDVRVDPIRDILYLRTYGLPAMSHEAVTWLFEVDLRKRIRTAGLEVDAAVLPPECAGRSPASCAESKDRS